MILGFINDSCLITSKINKTNDMILIKTVTYCITRNRKGADNVKTTVPVETTAARILFMNDDLDETVIFGKIFGKK